MNKDLLKSKTVWTGVASIIAALGGYFTGSMDAGTSLQTGIAGLIAIFLRDGIRKGETK